MSIAEHTKSIIQRECPETFSLYSGYGYKGHDRSAPARFPTGVQIAERRNDKGRCMFAAYQYADDSVLEYQYKGDGKYTLTTK